MDIDRKFQIHAKNVVSRKLYTEGNAILFLARDAALLPTLQTYLNVCRELGSSEEHLSAVESLQERVKAFQNAGTKDSYRIPGFVPPNYEETEGLFTKEGDVNPEEESPKVEEETPQGQDSEESPDPEEAKEVTTEDEESSRDDVVRDTTRDDS